MELREIAGHMVSAVREHCLFDEFVGSVRWLSIIGNRPDYLNKAKDNAPCSLNRFIFLS